MILYTISNKVETIVWVLNLSWCTINWEDKFNHTKGYIKRLFIFLCLACKCFCYVNAKFDYIFPLSNVCSVNSVLLLKTAIHDWYCNYCRIHSKRYKSIAWISYQKDVKFTYECRSNLSVLNIQSIWSFCYQKGN